ncbi:PQQ-like beta-propeller repeat protein [Niabella beijingensis]|uniref:PQQ-like beta-propeller repeat protein n=1 Tax=Niabella beijingensis TaxID=2872700 RepID=UPI001CBD314D|nr:PQQ-like beta-propeller repeat protein [Niabella beijingensis]MBZ4187756.1 PQQ-like beta-propeller repeat protein [Niabella beijingensis]
MRKLLCVIVLFLMVPVVRAQQFGGNPPAVRWKQINTDTMRIIYPEKLDTTASRIAAIINDLAAKNYHPLGKRLKKIDIVLQNQPVNSNGYVSLGPFRSEFYLTPPSDNFDQGSLHWPDQLALHEYRHVEQYNNFNRGLSRVMKTLFGQEGYAVAINAAIPNWFFEGDAVYQETSLSAQGRGRMPSFLKAFPSLWSDGKQYRWMKLRNGSLKDYVPNHYDLGYLLVNYGYERYGADFWGKVTSEAAAYKGLLYPLQKAITRNTGLSYKNFTTAAFAFYRDRFGSRTTGAFNDSAAAVFPADHKTLTSYYYPQQVSADSLLYLKTSNKERPGFYLLDKKGEHRLRIRDISSEQQFSYANGRIVYAAVETDPRWSWKTYSVLRVVDLKTGAQKRLTKKTRYFSPDIAADGNRIVANKVDLLGHSSLVELDAASGAVLREFSAAGTDYFANPRIKDADRVVTAIRQKDGTTYVGLVDLNEKTIRPLTPPSFKTVGQVSITGDTVYFVGADDLSDAVFSVELTSGALRKLKTAENNSYFVNAGFGKLNRSRFTADGFQLRQSAAATAVWEPQEPAAFVSGTTGIVSDSLTGGSGPLEQETGLLPSKKYHALTRPINLHSWRPNYDDPEYSFTIYGNNVLNTTQTELYYLYNENDRTHAVGGTLTYAGLFPYIGIGTQYRFNRNQVVQKKLRQWDQWDNYLSLSVPLNWNHGREFRFFNLGTNIGYRQDFSRGVNQAGFPSSGFGYITHSMGLGTQVQRAIQDIYPRWGINLSTQYQYAVNKWSGQQLFARTTAYLPGIFKTHSLVLSAAWQEAFSRSLLFSNRINFARGFNGIDSARIGTVTAAYHLPLWYPDWGFGNILYLQRLRGAAFYDYTAVKGKQTGYYRGLQSAGIEIYADTQWWNQHPLTFGFRTGRLLTRDPVTPGRSWFYEFILPVSIIPR